MMNRQAPFAGAWPSSVPWAAAVTCIFVAACGAQPGPEEPSASCLAVAACEPPTNGGDDPASFCDDHNPCTEDVDCTPCSTLPSSERDIYHCTADEQLPPACARRTGCFHIALDTPPGQIDDCFPVAAAAELHAGSCRAGHCVDNGT